MTNYPFKISVALFTFVGTVRGQGIVSVVAIVVVVVFYCDIFSVILIF